jgi:predicted ArsR family transcriptional regulator
MSPQPSDQTDKPPDLFDLLPPPALLSTRQEAQAAAALRAKERYGQVLALLRDRGPLTCFEIAGALGCQLNAISGRLTELKDQGEIESTGERRKNPATGRSSEVLRLRSGSL